LSFTFENNIVYYDTGVLLSGPWTKVRVNMDKNCYWDSAGRDVTLVGKALEDWQKETGRDKNSIIADPLFVDPENGDFRLQPDSPALKIGFKPFDYSKAGVYGKKSWIDMARMRRYPPLEIAPDPPPVSIRDDFERTNVGSRPSFAQVHIEGKGDAITVTDTTAAKGRRSLRIVDAPGLQHAFNPHLVYVPNHSEGVTRCSFDMRIEEGVQLNHEWRDWRSSPYRVGPSFWVNGTKLNVRERDLMDLPLGKWAHFEVAARLQNQAVGTWDLTVTLAGQAPRKFHGLKNGTAKFEKLTWVGFTSNATKTTVFYLDNVEIINNS
jgi:hypothetical protein